MPAVKKRSQGQCRQWERQRRGRLCAAFAELAAALPAAPPADTKILILQRSLLYIKTLQANTDQRAGSVVCQEKEKRLRLLEQRCEQLALLLKAAGLPVPAPETGLLLDKGTPAHADKETDKPAHSEVTNSSSTVDKRVEPPMPSPPPPASPLPTPPPKEHEEEKKQKTVIKKKPPQLKKKLARRKPSGAVLPLAANTITRNVWVSSSTSAGSAGLVLLPPPPTILLVQRPPPLPLSLPLPTPLYSKIYGIDVTKTTMVNKMPIPACSALPARPLKPPRPTRVTQKSRSRLLKRLGEAKDKKILNKHPAKKTMDQNQPKPQTTETIATKQTITSIPKKPQKGVEDTSKKVLPEKTKVQPEPAQSLATSEPNLSVDPATKQSNFILNLDSVLFKNESTLKVDSRKKKGEAENVGKLASGSDMTEDFLASLSGPPEAEGPSPLAASPTAAFLQAFPVVCPGPRPDTPNLCSLDPFTALFSSKDTKVEESTPRAGGRPACALADFLFPPPKAPEVPYSLVDSIFNYEHASVVNDNSKSAINSFNPKLSSYQDISQSSQPKSKFPTSDELMLFGSSCESEVTSRARTVPSARTEHAADRNPFSGCSRPNKVSTYQTSSDTYTSCTAYNPFDFPTPTTRGKSAAPWTTADPFFPSGCNLWSDDGFPLETDSTRKLNSTFPDFQTDFRFPTEVPNYKTSRKSVVGMAPSSTSIQRGTVNWMTSSDESGRRGGERRRDTEEQLPALVGDLALNLPVSQVARTPRSNCNNINSSSATFFSVSQLVERPPEESYSTFRFSSKNKSDRRVAPAGKTFNRNNYSTEALLQNDCPRTQRRPPQRQPDTYILNNSEQQEQPQGSELYSAYSVNSSSYFMPDLSNNFIFPLETTEYPNNMDMPFKLDNSKKCLDVEKVGYQKQPAVEGKPSMRSKRRRPPDPPLPTHTYFTSSQMHPYPPSAAVTAAAPAATTHNNLTNFNLSTIFPEIDKNSFTNSINSNSRGAQGGQQYQSLLQLH